MKNILQKIFPVISGFFQNDINPQMIYECWQGYDKIFLYQFPFPICHPCNPGTFWHRVKKICLACPIGTFQGNYHKSTCTRCDNGMTTSMKASKSVKQCFPIKNELVLGDEKPLNRNSKRQQMSLRHFRKKRFIPSKSTISPYNLKQGLKLLNKKLF